MESGCANGCTADFKNAVYKYLNCDTIEYKVKASASQATAAAALVAIALVAPQLF